MSNPDKKGTFHIKKVALQALDSYSHDTFLQKSFWALHKERFGWKAHAFEIMFSNAEDPYVILVLERRLIGRYAFLYVPHAPHQKWMTKVESFLQSAQGTVLHTLAKHFSNLLGAHTVFVRYDLNWALFSRPCVENNNLLSQEENNDSLFDASKLRKDLRLPPLNRSQADVQPPDTVLLNIQQDAAAILAAMKPKTRYNIRLAEKKGVLVLPAGIDCLAEWYELYRLTGERDKIALHSFEYYRTLLENNQDKCELLLAYHEKDLLAGIILLYTEERATYLYGASGNIKRNLMPAYALQWAGIQAAIKRGCTTYDFFGLPPSNDPAHPMHGLFQFKTGFGGQLISMPGCWDARVQPVLYNLIRFLEALRYWYFKKLRKNQS